MTKPSCCGGNTCPLRSGYCCPGGTHCCPKDLECVPPQGWVAGSTPSAFLEASSVTGGKAAAGTWHCGKPKQEDTCSDRSTCNGPVGDNAPVGGKSSDHITPEYKDDSSLESLKPALVKGVNDQQFEPEAKRAKAQQEKTSVAFANGKKSIPKNLQPPIGYVGGVSWHDMSDQEKEVAIAAAKRDKEARTTIKKLSQEVNEIKTATVERNPEADHLMAKADAEVVGLQDKLEDNREKLLNAIDDRRHVEHEMMDRLHDAERKEEDAKNVHSLMQKDEDQNKRIAQARLTRARDTVLKIQEQKRKSRDTIRDVDLNIDRIRQKTAKASAVVEEFQKKKEKLIIDADLIRKHMEVEIKEIDASKESSKKLAKEKRAQFEQMHKKRVQDMDKLEESRKKQRSEIDIIEKQQEEAKKKEAGALEEERKAEMKMAAASRGASEEERKANSNMAYAHEKLVTEQRHEKDMAWRQSKQMEQVKKHEANKAMAAEETVKAEVELAKNEANRALQQQKLSEEKTKSADAESDRAGAAIAREEGEKAKQRLQDLAKHREELENENKRNEEAVKQTSEEKDKQEAKEAADQKANNAAEQVEEQAQKAAKRSAREAEREDEVKKIDQDAADFEKEKTERVQKARSEALELINKANKELSVAQQAFEATREALAAAEAAQKAIDDNQELSVKVRSDLLVKAAEAAESHAHSLEIAATNATTAVNTATDAVSSAKLAEDDELQKEASQARNTARNIERETVSALGAARELAQLRKDSAHDALSVANEVAQQAAAEQEKKKALEESEKANMRANDKVFESAWDQVAAVRDELNAAHDMLNLQTAQMKLYKKAAEEDKTADSYEIAVEAYRGSVETLDYVTDVCHDGSKEAAVLIDAAEDTKNSTRTSMAREEKQYFDMLGEELSKLELPMKETYKALFKVYAKTREAEIALARNAEENAKSLTQREEAEKAKLAAEAKNAIPIPLDMLKRYSDYGDNFRVSQYARAGPICSLGGVAFSQEMKGELGKINNGECRPHGRASFDIASVDGLIRVEVNTLGEVEVQGGALTSEALPLDMIHYPAKETDVTPLALSDQWQSIGGDYSVPSAAVYRDLCILTGTVKPSVNNAKLIAKLPEQCYPTNGGIRGLLDISESGEIMMVENVFKRDNLALDGILFSLKKPSPFSKLLNQWKADTTGNLRAPGSSLHGPLCVLQGSVTGGAAGTSIIGTLDPECLPASGMVWAQTFIGFQPIKIVIDQAGDVTVFDAPDKASISLDGISFMVTPAQDWEKDLQAAADEKRIALETAKRFAEETEKSQLLEERNKKLKADSTPNQLVPTAPAEEFGRHYRIPQYSKKGSICFVSGSIGFSPLKKAEAVGSKMVNLGSGCLPGAPEKLIFPGVNAEGAMNQIAVSAGDKAVTFEKGVASDIMILNPVAFSTSLEDSMALKMTLGWLPIHGVASPSATMAGDLCVLSGAAEANDDWANPIAQLPENCRPDKVLSFPIINGKNVHRVTINPAGQVSYATDVKRSPRDTWVSFGGISFFTKSGNAVSLLNRATSLSTSSERPVSLKKEDNVCSLSGSVRVVGGSFAIIPKECRPSMKLHFAVVSDKGDAKTAILTIDSTGEVTVAPGDYTLGGATWTVSGLQQWETDSMNKILKIQQAREVAAANALAAAANQRKNDMKPVSVSANEGDSSWFAYGQGFRLPQSTRFGKICILSGMFGAANNTWKTVTAQLLPSCHPKDRLVFDVHGVAGTDTTRVDIEKDGSVRYAAGVTGRRLPIDGMVYPSASASVSNIDLGDEWSNHDNGYSGATYTVDSEFCVVSGLVRNEKQEWNSYIGTIPAACRPNSTVSFNANHNGFTHRVDVNPNGQMLWKDGERSNEKGVNWLSLSNIRFPTNKAVITPIVLSQGWSVAQKPLGPPSFFLAENFCALTGAAQGDGSPLIAVLPAQCRPASGKILFAVQNAVNTLSEVVQVSPNGNVEWVDGTVTSGILSLDSISFMTANVTEWEKESQAEVEKRVQATLASEAAARKNMSEPEQLIVGAGATAVDLETRLLQFSRFGSLCIMSGSASISPSYDSFTATVGASCQPQAQRFFDVHTNSAATVRVDVTKEGSISVPKNTFEAAEKSGVISLDGLITFVPDRDSISTTLHNVRLAQPWMAAGGEYGDSVRVVKDNGFCLVSGIAMVKTVSDWTPIMGIMPPQCRPESRLRFTVSNEKSSHVVDVLPSGQIVWIAGEKASERVSLNGISFFPVIGEETSTAALPLSGGFSAAENGFRAPSMQRVDHLCALSGLVKADGQKKEIGTVPAKCRPLTGRLRFSVPRVASATNSSDFSSVMVVIEKTGKLTYLIDADEGVFSLDSIRYSVTPSPQWEQDIRNKMLEAIRAKERAEEEARKRAEQQVKAEQEAAAKKAAAAEAEKKRIEEQRVKTAHKLSLASSMEPYGKDYAVPQFHVDGDACFLGGVVYAKDVKKLITTLPSSCRPYATQVFNQHVTGRNNLEVAIDTKGEVKFFGSKESIAATYIPLNGMVFPAGDAEIMDLKIHRGHWSNYGRDDMADLTYVKVGDMCVITGTVRATSFDRHIAQIPADCRPKEGHTSWVIGGGEKGQYEARMDIRPDGWLYLQSWNGNDNVWRLDGIAILPVMPNRLSLAFGWAPYNSGYRPPSWKKQGKVCIIGGAARSSTSGVGRRGLVATVPDACRPNKKLIFHTTQDSGNSHRVEVHPDGKIMYVDGPLHGDQHWLCLDGITYVVDLHTLEHNEAEAKLVTRTLPLEGNFKVKFEEDYMTPQVHRFGSLCMVSGLAGTDKQLSGIITTLPDDCKPAAREIFVGHTAKVATVRMDVTTDGLVKWEEGASDGGWIALSPIMFGVEGTRFTTLTLNSQFKPYDGFQRPSFFKVGDLCVLSGVLRTVNDQAVPSTWLFDLPKECRPHDGTLQVIGSHGQFTHGFSIDKATGRLSYAYGSRSNSWVSISGIAFHTRTTESLEWSLGYGNHHGWSIAHTSYRAPSWSMVDNICFLSGALHRDGGNAWPSMAVLPRSCRPSKRHIFHVYTSCGGVVRLDVLSDGRVIVSEGSTSCHLVSLTGIRFVADANEFELTENGDWTFAEYGSIALADGVTSKDDETKAPQFALSGNVCILGGVLKTKDLQGSYGKLPTNCRPIGRSMFQVSTAWQGSYHVPMRIDIMEDGEIKWMAGGAGETVSLEGIKFVVNGTDVRPLPLLGNWVGHRGYVEPHYYLQGDMCVVGGVIHQDGGRITSHRYMAQIPEECWPQQNVWFTGNQGAHWSPIEIYNENGLILRHSSSISPASGSADNVNFISLSNIAYFRSMDDSLNVRNGYNTWHHGWKYPSIKKEGNLCVVSGMVYNSRSSGEIAFVPAECRPSKRVQFSVFAGYAPQRVDLSPDGRLKFMGYTGHHGGGWLNLEGIQWTTETWQEPMETDSADDTSETTTSSSDKSVIPLKLINGVRAYGQGYRAPSYSIVDDSLCVLSGRIFAPDVRTTYTILPKECRPEARHTFNVITGTYSAVAVRVDVYPTGEVSYISSKMTGGFFGSWVDLSTIMFPIATSKVKAYPADIINYYTPYGNGFAKSEVRIFDGGFCMYTGVVRNTYEGSLQESDNDYFRLPSQCRPNTYRYHTGSNGHFQPYFYLYPDGRYRMVSRDSNLPFPYMAIGSNFYNVKEGKGLSFSSGWSNYGYGHLSLNYIKHKNLCHVQGLLRGGRQGTIAYLPADCRPSDILTFQSALYNDRVDVMPDGRVMSPFGNKHGLLYVNMNFVATNVTRGESGPFIKDSSYSFKALNLTDNAEQYKRGYAEARYARWGGLCVGSGSLRVDQITGDYALFGEDCKPPMQLAFQTSSFIASSNGWIESMRIDVTRGGMIEYKGGLSSLNDGSYNGNRVDLSQIIFPANDVNREPLTLSNNWVPAGRGYAEPAWVMQGDLCVLSGMAKNLITHFSFGSENWIAKMPSHCIPSDGHIVMNLNQNECFIRVMIHTNGYMYYQAEKCNNHPFLSLSGVAFVPESASQPLSMSSGWGSYGYGYRRPSYRKQGDFCILSGMANGNGARTVLNLPKGCHPYDRQSFIVNHHQYLWQLDVHNDGKVEWRAGYRAHGFVSLDGIRFFAKKEED